MELSKKKDTNYQQNALKKIYMSLPFCSFSNRDIERLQTIFLSFIKKYKHVFKHITRYIYTSNNERLTCYMLLCYFCPYVTSTYTFKQYIGYYDTVFLFHIQHIQHSSLRTLHIIPFLSLSHIKRFKKIIDYTSTLYNDDNLICPNIITFQNKQKQYIHDTDNFGSYITEYIEQTLDRLLQQEEETSDFLKDKMIDVLYILIRCNYYHKIIYNNILKSTDICIKNGNACFFNFVHAYDYSEFKKNVQLFTNNNVEFLDIVKPFFKYLFFLQYDDFIKTYIDKKYINYYINQKIIYIQKNYKHIDENNFLTKLHILRTNKTEEYDNLYILLQDQYNMFKEKLNIDLYYHNKDQYIIPFIKTLRHLCYFYIYNEYIFPL